MEIKENTKTKVVLKAEGSDATICNLLREELWTDEKVKIAGFNIDHPLIGEPQIIIETTSPRKPLEATKDALDRLAKRTTKLSKEFAKAK
ncbi:MAG: RpoL/Rpb11 RNA polymerase subunit family protein [Candidatus Woesearchaeota archaeon]